MLMLYNKCSDLAMKVLSIHAEVWCPVDWSENKITACSESEC